MIISPCIVRNFLDTQIVVAPLGDPDNVNVATPVDPHGGYTVWYSIFFFKFSSPRIFGILRLVFEGFVD